MEDVIYVSQGGIPMSVGDAAYQWSCEDPGLTSRYDQIVGASACLYKSFFAKLLTPKDGVNFILASLTNRIHQVDSRILIGPCF